MKKILAGLFIFGALTIGVRQASAFTLNDALLQIQSLRNEIAQLRASLKASVGDATAPTLVIYPIMQDYYAQTYVTLGMEITSRGTPAVTTPLLIYYGTTPHPTTSSVSIPLSANSIYQYKVSNLTCGTKYYYYGSFGVSNSTDATFTTSACSNATPTPPPPTVTLTPTSSSVTSTSATIRANISGSVAAVISEYSVCFKVNISSTNYGCVPATSSGNGSFSMILHNLIPSTNYIYFGYIASSTATSTTCFGTTSCGWLASSEGTFTTLASTSTSTYVNLYTSFGPNGTITPSGTTQINSGVGLTQKYTVTPNSGYTPTMSGCGGSLSGNVYTTATITGQCTVTATFAPTPVNNYIPTVSSPIAQNITSTSAIMSASVTGLGSPSTITSRGICYGPSTVAITPDCITSTSNTVTAYPTNLTPGTIYKFRGFAINATGTGYSEYGTFATPAVTALVNLYTSFGPNGTITPSGTTQINSGVGLTQKYTVTPNSGYTPTVTGCGGSLSGNVYTTAPITSQCTVTATFTPITTGTPSITVLSPNNGNEVYTAGQQITVKWESSNYSSSSPINISIGYVDSSIGFVGTYIENLITTTNTGSQVVNLPTIRDPFGIGTHYKIFVSNSSDPLSATLVDSSNNLFTINSSTAPSVTVTSPNGGESYIVGQQVLVKWQSYNYPSTGYVQVVLKSTQFDTGIVILDGLLNDGEEMITIPSVGGPGMLPLISGKYYKIYVSIAGNSSLSDVSNDTFTINPSSTTPSITVTSPNGEDTYKPGDKVLVKWTSANLPSGTKIRVIFNYQEDLKDSFNSSHSYYVDNNGSMEYTLPIASDFKTGSFPFLGKYFEFTVSAMSSSLNSSIAIGSSAHGSNNNLFTINSSTAPSVTVTSPNGGESYIVGQQVLVKWQSYNYPSTGYVQVVLKSTQFDTGIVILDGLLNDGEEMITIPSVGGPGMLPLISGKYYKIYVSIAGNSSLSDVSNDTFTINSSAKMNSEDNGCLPGYKFSTTISNYLCPDSNSLKSATIFNQNNNASINRTLKWGTRGDDVKILQQFLGIGADGIFGRGTAAAVKAWQATNGLTPDGLFGYYSRTTAGL